MPRPKAAQTWVPNVEEQQIIDKIADYALIAERCAAHLRTVDPLITGPLWTAIKTEWLKDPAKYSSLIGPTRYDTDEVMRNKFGGKSFSTKVEEICRKEPHTTSDYISMYFAVTSGVQGINDLELDEHKFDGEFFYRANLIVQKALRGEAAVNATLERENKAQNENPFEWVGETICVYEPELSRHVEYTVVDCTSSVLKGQWVTIQEDSCGPHRDIPYDEMVDMLKRRVI